MVLASCSFEDSKKYRNKLVIDDGSKKQEEVLLNIVTDDPDSVLKEGLGSAKCLTTSVRPNYCPKDAFGNVFHEIPLDEFKGVYEEDGVVCLVRLPDGFSDMRKAEEICMNSEGFEDVEHKVRVIGGNLLEIPGIFIGRYDTGKEKMSAVFNGVYDIFREVDLCELSVKEVFGKLHGKSRSSQGKSKKLTPRVKVRASLESLFGTEEDDF